MRWFKIADDKFICKDISIQYNMDTANNTYGYAKIVHSARPNIDVTVIMENTAKNSTYFFNLYSQRSTGKNASDYKFDINAYHFTASGCIIKSISTDPQLNQLVMEIMCDYSTVIPIEERRNEVIEQILDETSEKKNNINQ